MIDAVIGLALLGFMVMGFLLAVGLAMMAVWIFVVEVYTAGQKRRRESHNSRMLHVLEGGL